MPAVNDYKKIDERTFDFALATIEAYKFLISKNEYVISKQLLRSGTSIGANVHEAQAAQSKKDFVAKMAIASKEARETDYWLQLLEKGGFFIDYPKKDEVMSENAAIINIITKIVKTSQSSMADRF